MKRTFKYLIIAVGFTALLASCQCKTCKKTGDPSVQICRGEGTEDEYNSALDTYQNWLGYTCN